MGHKSVQARRAWQKKYREKNPEKVRALKARYYQKHKEKIKEKTRAYHRRVAPERSRKRKAKYKALSPAERKTYLETSRVRKLKRRYGLTVEQYDALLAKQNGVCAICHRPEAHKKYVRLSVDHNHATGKVRGLLCRRCNSMLANGDDDPARLIQGAQYLTAHR